MSTNQRIFRTAEGEIVAEGDPRAAFLLAGPADEIPEEFADKVAEFLGANPAPEAPAVDVVEIPEPEVKEAAKAPNKARGRARNK